MDTGVDPGLVLKVTPPKLRKSLLLRERLRRIPSDESEASVLLVEAPAGHGKTSLLAQWRLDWMQAGAAVAWLSLDHADTAVSIVSGMVEGLRRATGQRSFGLEAIEAVRRGADPIQGLTSLLAEITEAAAPTVLVFDNFERVRAETLLDVFDYLLHNLPPNLQVAFGSRPPAPLRVVDLLGSGVLRRITPEQLRFDLAETIRLLTARLGERVDTDSCARLHEITEGWPLGLQIAASALERAADPAAAVAAFAASREDTTRQLFDSMLRALPTPLCDFVTKCGLLDALHPSLCESVTGEERAGLYLQQLLVETPLLSATEDGEWIRFHPLAREFLRSRAEETLSEADRRDVHRGAWQWFAARGSAERAAQHALAAGLRQDAFALIAGSLYDDFLAGNAGTVVEWLSRIPPEDLQANETLRSAALWMRSMDYRTAADVLPEVLTLADETSASAWLRGEAVLMAANVYGYADDVDRAQESSSRFPAGMPDSTGRRVRANQEGAFAIYAGATERARQFLVHSPNDGKFPISRVWADFFAGLSYLWEGRPILAEQATLPAHASWEMRVGRRGDWASMVGSMLAAARWQRDLREDARALLANRVDVIERSTLPEGVIVAYRTLSRIAAAEGDEARSLAYLEALASLGASRALQRFVIISLAERIRLHAAGRRVAQASALMAELTTAFEAYRPCSMLEALLRLEYELARSFAAWASGDLAGVEVALQEAAAHASRINRGYELVQVVALKAVLAERRGEPWEVLLTEALSRAAVGDLVRVFADTLPEVVALIRRFAEANSVGPVARSFVDRVLAAARVETLTAPESTPAAGRAILTPKEQAVLELLAGGLPNKRIATELGLSADTVKWHVKKLSAKLGAGSREHAVARARMLGLLR
jgi:LuxR family maltose regulon positive regulatory protein